MAVMQICPNWEAKASGTYKTKQLMAVEDQMAKNVTVGGQ